MKEKTEERMQKFVELCDSGKPWYVFLAMFSVLLAAAALLELFTDQHVKKWIWAADALGILGCLANIRYCKKLKAEKAEKDSTEEEDA